MSFFNNKSAPSGGGLNANSVVALTPDGIDKANSQNLDGALGEVIAALSSEHTAPIKQLVQLTGLGERQIIDVVRTNPVYIQPKRVGVV
jgi:predicted outer membrane repeat protein